MTTVLDSPDAELVAFREWVADTGAAVVDGRWTPSLHRVVIEAVDDPAIRDELNDAALVMYRDLQDADRRHFLDLDGDDCEYEVVVVSSRWLPGVLAGVEADPLPKPACGQQAVFTHQLVETEYGTKIGVDVPYEHKEAVKNLSWDRCHPTWDGDRSLWLIDATRGSVRYAARELSARGLNLYLSAEAKVLRGD